jgi:hypothetical protein
VRRSTVSVTGAGACCSRRKLALRRVSSRPAVALISLGTIPAGALVSPFVQLPLLALVLIAVFSIELSRQRRAT